MGIPRRFALILLVAALFAGAACSTSGDGTATSNTPVPPGSTPPGSSAGGSSTTSVPFTRPSAPPGPLPSVTPASGGKGTPNAPAPAALLADAGYVEEELVLAGDATRYQPTGTWGEDGVWGAEPAGTAPYATRVLVRRPTDAAKFNGTVLVEWVNVTAGADVAVDFGFLNRELLDQGYVYVGVSAQRVGHQAAKESDPARYEALVHPGDEYSYDIFTQAGRAVLANKLFAPSFPIRKIIADGESQSAGRLTTYINAVQPLVDLYDAFLVHSRSDRIVGLAPDQPPVPPSRIRTDLRSPTLVVLTETDVLGNLKSAQDDSDRYRRWEIAGSAHLDNYDLAVLSGTDPNQPALLGKVCEKPINTAHQYWVMNAGLRHLAAWIGGGPPPPTGPRMTIAPDGTTYVTDEHGNAKGGIRLADLEVPIATQTGLGNAPSFCRLYGTSAPFDAAKLRQLYPDHDAYVKAFDGAVDTMAAQGFILDREVADAKREARAAAIP